ncbi:MAG: aldehyde ferredoxin oxidoreductase N-terminal domain-containing protein, partial [Candidatus Binatia bacterium]
MYGFHGRLLHVDLTTGSCSWHDLGESRLRAFLGGGGLGTSLLYDFAPPGVEPFAPANPLIFTSAPLVGTGLTTTAKFAVVTKSPLTGFIADSLSSSFFALELKRAGLDALVVTGAAAAPVYLWISEDRVEVRDATPLWGKSTRETETAIRTDLRDPEVRVAAIGQAGENRVRFATISTEGRHAGRGGTGAVMGAKNLKAVALRGHRRVHVADPRGVETLSAALR